MNILFYTTNEVAPQYGGVERVTANIANALTTFYNVNCYSACLLYTSDAADE